MQLPTDIELSQQEMREEGEDGAQSFGLNDFLSFANSAYSTYAKLEQSGDTAKIAQANAAQQNLQLQAQQQQGEQMKKILLIGGAVLGGIIVLLIIVKLAFKR